MLSFFSNILITDLPDSEGTMKAARGLVNFFNSSPQALKKLREKQVNGRELVPIQDVVTRWWSTYSMCDRLILLRIYITLLSDEGELKFVTLTDRQWAILVDLHALLKPFMIVQRLLEGQAYVTISLVPYMVYKMRKGLQYAIDSDASSMYVKSISREMLLIFNKNFGDGADGTVAVENLVLGERSRPKGLNMLMLMSSFLDPRMKGGVGIAPDDQDAIYAAIRSNMIEIASVNAEVQPGDFDAEAHVQPEGPNNNNNNNNLDYEIFDEINHHFMAQTARNDDPVAQNAGQVQELVDAELALYKREPAIALQSGPGKFNDPLKWWEMNRRKFKILSVLAARVLCIPATSAPSERVFSVAGLTIAKDRARLASGTANDLIFLHEALPAIERYKQSLEAI